MAVLLFLLLPLFFFFSLLLLTTFYFSLLLYSMEEWRHPRVARGEGVGRGQVAPRRCSPDAPDP